MQRVLRYLTWAVVVVVGLAALLLAGGYVYLRGSLPQVDGTISVGGLKGPVEVTRDRDAVAHVFAGSAEDAYWGLGYTHAQDRLWQMELQRRATQGRLSEVFGAPAVPSDRLLRTLGLQRAARRDWDSLPAESKQLVEAYVRGVNAFIGTHGGRGLPPEFTVMNTAPEPFEGPDVLAAVKLLSWNLDGIGYLTELLRHDLTAAVGGDRANQLLPDSPGHAVTIQGPPLAVYERLYDLHREMAELAGMVGPNAGGLGSNGWVVGGEKSATGKPLLANDPHLGTSLPSIWYLAHLSAGELDVTGATIPGLPMLVIGRNQFVGWGVTHFSADVQDMFLVRLSADETHTVVRDQPRPIETLNEVIRVKGRPDIQYRVRVTAHGPLVSDALNANENDLPPDRRQPPLPPMALRWSSLEPGDATVDGFFKVNRARNWDEFKTGLQNITAPALNFMYADAAGNIGYHAAGRVPVRGGGEGTAPAEGWTGQGEWTGWVAFGDLPQAYNPPEQFLVNANNRPVPPSYPYYLGRHWASEYRAARITQLLRDGGKFSLDDMAAIQRDTVSGQAAELLPVLLSLVTPRDEEERRAVEILKGWDGRAEGDSAGAAVYETWLAAVPRVLLNDELGPRLRTRYEERFDFLSRFLASALSARNGPWCDDVSTPGPEDCSHVASESLREALKVLKARSGSDPARWRWDDLHQVVFPHRPFHNVEPLRRFFSRRVKNGGDRSTVNFGSFGANQSFDQFFAPGYRQLLDLSAPDTGLFILAGGQAGHFLSPHYDEYIEEWRAGRYRPMRLSRPRVEADRMSVLRLQP